MKIKGVIGLLLTAGSVVWGAPSDIQIQAVIPAGNPSQTNLAVGLTLSGKDLKEIKGMRCVMEKAVDDTGKSLLMNAQELTRTNQNWTPLVYDPKTPPCLQLKLDPPARNAVQLKELAGRLEILTPVHDPMCLLKFSNLAAQLDVELADPSLKAAQLKIKVLIPEVSKGKPSVVVRVEDPLSKLVYFEIVDGKGREWDAVATKTVKGAVTTYSYPGTLPENASIRICVPTPKSIISVPFQIKNVNLLKNRQ
jgi:hypothetical protein